MKVSKVASSIVSPDVTPVADILPKDARLPVSKCATFVLSDTVPAVGLLPVFPPGPDTNNIALCFLMFVRSLFFEIAVNQMKFYNYLGALFFQG